MSSSWQNHPSIKELKANTRLQWMLVGVIAILALSVLKALSDTVGEQRVEVTRALAMQARLEQVAHLTVDEEVIRDTADQLEQIYQAIPEAASASVAEAKALAEIEQKVGSLLTRKRLSLIGSEVIRQGNTILWSVRIDVNGQLSNDKFIALLSQFDQLNQDRRITSLQYSPKASDTLNIVVDVLFRQASDE